MRRECYISSRAYRAAPRWMLAAVFAALIAVAVIVFYSARKEPADYTASRNVFLDHISVNGIEIGGMTYNDALDAIVEKAHQTQNSWSLNLVCNGFTYSTITYATIGISVDYAAIESALYKAWSYGHSGTYEDYVADKEALASAPFAVNAGFTEGDTQNLDYILGVIADNIYTSPTDAFISSFVSDNAQNPFAIEPEKNGRCIDKETAKETILTLAAEGTGGTYDIPIEEIPPSVTTEMVRENVALLATGKNAIDKHSTDERTDNIRLAFSKINGTVLENGKTFSFNKTVGNRTIGNGFKSALGYVSGEMVEVVGGGVCQASTTLYSAALCAGLTITEREPHSMPVSYIELGQDATVNYMRGHMIDLKFKNETGYPIYITASIEENASGRLMSVVRIYGRELEDDVHYRVESTELEVLPVPEEPVIRKDEDGKYVKYTDQTYVYSKGSEGHVVETYLLKLRGSDMVERKLISKDTYKAQPRIEYVGILDRE